MTVKGRCQGILAGRGSNWINELTCPAQLISQFFTCSCIFFTSQKSINKEESSRKTMSEVHCSHVGPHLGTLVPMGTKINFLVPIWSPFLLPKVPISLKMRSPFGPHFEKIRSPFHSIPFWHYFHNLDIILQHSDIDVEIIGDIICPTSEEDSCTWFLQALPVRDPVFMK